MQRASSLYGTALAKMFRECRSRPRGEKARNAGNSQQLRPKSSRSALKRSQTAAERRVVLPFHQIHWSLPSPN